ncbi:acyltransferase family protein [Granulicella sp. S190]|uniref:acyltransferase family protein n=1 Tax=Granulicella sp. S190 TaxID=1747226 RepID=UPI00131C7F7A|nr:heparan-alpha-glucosaminide N-acetyltransferase domain-containing protein [Granulicella sp. S190]
MPSASLAQSTRLVSLDVLRGLTIAGMILVTDPGSYSFVYAPLRHAEWESPTTTDMIFPSFLVAVGISIALSFASRIRRGSTRGELFRHVVQRTVVMILLGLILNGFPDYHLATLRFSGILQRIAVCYLFGSTLYLSVYTPPGEGERRERKVFLVLALTTLALLVAYWALLKLYPVPGFGAGHLDSFMSLPAYVDRAVFGIPHLWPYGTTAGHGVTFDPEGVVSTLGALATLLVGVLAGQWLLTAASAVRKITVLAVAGAGLVCLGLALSPVMPLTKKIWTPTFAVLSGGVVLLVFCCLYYLLDMRQWRRWAVPVLVFGSNAILAFAISTVITTLSDRIQVGAETLTLHKWGFQMMTAWFSPIHASLAYGLVIVAINLALIYPFYRRRIFLRI